MNGTKFAIAFALTVSAAAVLATPATAGFKAGNYTQTLFSGPDHQALNPTCVTFTKTGGIVGFKSSGTWAVGDTIGGNYVADGNDLRWYGIRTGTSIVLNRQCEDRQGRLRSLDSRHEPATERGRRRHADTNAGLRLDGAL